MITEWCCMYTKYELISGGLNPPDLRSTSMKVDQINIFIKIFFSGNTPVDIET